jgi:hypothetical protein
MAASRRRGRPPGSRPFPDDRAVGAPERSRIRDLSRRRHRAHRVAVRLATCVGYGTILYYSVAHLSGYALFERRTVGVFLLFYLVNAPWLLGSAYMVADSCRAVTRAFRTASGTSP